MPLSDTRVMREAIKIFNEKCPAHGLTRLGRFIKRWGDRLPATGTVHDAPGRGRKSKLTPEMCKDAVELLVNGEADEDGEWAPFFDIDHALRASAPLRCIQRKAGGINSRTLWRRLTQFDKALKRKIVHFKPELTPDQKRERVRCCKWVLSMPKKHMEDYLRRTFWIDAKKMYISPKYCKVICSNKRPIHNLGHQLKSPRAQDRVVVHYYAVVNYFQGPVLYVEVSGTTRYTGETYKKYKVSLHARGVQRGQVALVTLCVCL